MGRWSYGSVRQARGLAGWQPAKQQIGNLRYVQRRFVRRWDSGCQRLKPNIGGIESQKRTESRMDMIK